MENTTARIECNECHGTLIVECESVGQINIPPEFFGEHAHMKSFTVSVPATDEETPAETQ